jgi:hypothetical protein
MTLTKDEREEVLADRQMALPADDGEQSAGR